MPQSAIDSQIQSRVEQFVSELSGLIREAAFEAVHSALGGGPAARPAPRSSKKVSRKKASRKQAGGRIRRSPADLGALSDSVISHVRSNPGQRLEEIGTALGVDTATLKQPIATLLAEGKLKKAGVARGTNYTVGNGRRGAKKASRKKGARRKRAARKTTSKATAE